jgi:hypothetical protein
MTSDKYKGVVEIEIFGEQRGFKFGMATMAMLIDLEGDTFANVVKKLEDSTQIKTHINFYYAAAVQYCRLLKKESEPSFEEVANWMDSVAATVKEKMTETAFSQYADPNAEAPNQTGQS